MTDVSFIDLLVRMVVSLAIVLGLMFGAYVFLRRRQGFGPVARPGGPRPVRGGRRSARRAGGGLGGLGGLGGAFGGASLTRATSSRAAGAPIDLLVNGRKIAAGEVVVIDEEFGIRITEIAPTGEQLR